MLYLGYIFIIRGDNIDYRYNLNYDIIGKRIREARKAKKWTQSELAENLGLSVNTIARLETNNATMSLKTAIKLANILEIDINYLVSDFNSDSEKPLDMLINSLLNEFSAKDKELLIPILTAIREYKKSV